MLGSPLEQGIITNDGCHGQKTTSLEDKHCKYLEPGFHIIVDHHVFHVAVLPLRCHPE